MTMIGSPKDSDTYKQLSEALYGKEKIDERKRQNVTYTLVFFWGGGGMILRDSDPEHPKLP